MNAVFKYIFEYSKALIFGICKVRMFFFLFQIEEMNNFFQKLDPRYLFGPDWDMYLITFFALAIGLIILLRRIR